jgi:hypothetical protein
VTVAEAMAEVAAAAGAAATDFLVWFGMWRSCIVRPAEYMQYMQM